MFVIPDLLDAAQCRHIRALLAEARFVDGRQTAGPGSRGVKNNLQGDPADPRIQEVQKLVHERLTGHPQYRILAVPRIVRPMTINRYDVGMSYGDHLDHPLLAGEPPARGDISTTVFLTAPEDYDGGELVVNSQFGEPEAFKLVAALDLVIMVPLLTVGGVWLSRRTPWGYVVACIAAVQASLYLLVLAVNSMLFLSLGLADPPGELPIWGTLALVTSVITLVLFSRKTWTEEA